MPGTDEAIEGVLLAEIPQTARVNKSLKAPDVVYQGAPEFKPIEKTTVERAVKSWAPGPSGRPFFVWPALSISEQFCHF